MAKPRVIVLAGYGLNCEEETAHAFELAGGKAEIVHINDSINDKNKLFSYQILAVPGGFSYGDDTGSGKAFANKLKNHLHLQMQKFAQGDKLIIGICNGFQILTQAGLLPGSLTFNDNARYTVRWVDLKITPPSIPPLTRGGKGGVSPWLTSIKKLMLPIAHGEGKFFADKETLIMMKKQRQIVATYIKGEICKMQNLSSNPNGSLADIAAVTSADGKILGLMPHPERAIFFTQLPHWTLLKEKLIRRGKKFPQMGPGIQIFKNAIRYFS